MGIGHLVICVLLAICSTSAFGQATSADASSSTNSYGTQIAQNLFKHLAAAEKNLYNGVTSISDPVLKFAVDTAPDLAHLYAIFNGVNVPPALAALAKDLYGRAAVGGGRVVESGVVAGSSVLGKALTKGGAALEAFNKVLEAAGKAGVDLSGKIADRLIKATADGANVTASGLSSLGDGMVDASLKANVLTQSIVQVIDSISARIVLVITSAEGIASKLVDGAKVLASGKLSFDSKVLQNLFETIVSSIKVLKNIQSVFDNVARGIASTSTSGSVTSR